MSTSRLAVQGFPRHWWCGASSAGCSDGGLSVLANVGHERAFRDLEVTAEHAAAALGHLSGAAYPLKRRRRARANSTTPPPSSKARLQLGPGGPAPNSWVPCSWSRERRVGEREAMATCARSGRPTPGMISEAMAQKRSSSRTRSDDGSSESGSPVSFASPPGSPVASMLHGTSVPRVRSHLNSGLHSPFSHSSLSRASSCTGSDAGSILHVEPSAHLSDIIVLKHVAPDQRSAAQVQRVLDMTRSDDSDQVVFARKGWPVITNAPVNLQAALARQVQVALVKAGRKIASEGSKVVRSYFVVHGHVSVREDLVTATGAGNKDQPFRLRTLAMGDTFGELPAGPRAQPHTSQRVTSKSDVILFSIEHSTYFKLVQGQRDADDHARKMDLLQHLYPAWGDADDEVAGNRRESDIAKMARILKLKTFQPGQHLVQQDREMAEIHFVCHYYATPV